MSLRSIVVFVVSGVMASAWGLPAARGAGDEDPVVSLAVAILGEGPNADRILVRGYESRRVEHNLFRSATGYTGWNEVPGERPGAPLAPDLLASVEVVALESPSGARLYVRGLQSGRLEQNLFTPAGGYSGWGLVPGSFGDGSAPLRAIDVAALGGPGGPRLFARAFGDGRVEQNAYLPQTGYTDWQPVPDPAPFAGDRGAQPLGGVVDVTIAAQGDLLDERIFVRAQGFVEQTLYGPGGYSGWQLVPGEFVIGAQFIEVAALDEPAGALLYVFGTAFNGAIWQNLFIPGIGFTDWDPLPRPASGAMRGLAIATFGGPADARLFLRIDDDGDVEQCLFTPGSGYGEWARVPE